uniref:Uncharacterized protein n=1 Tax=Anopheles coluzzii TaxID=1518534 RepID=A0A8W7Q2V1_ANOCL
MEHDKQPQPSESVTEVVEKELTEDTELVEAKVIETVVEKVEAKVIETVVEKVEAKTDDKPEQDEQPEPSEPVSEVVEKELTEDTELVEAKVIETVVEKVEAKPDDKPEQDEQPEPSEPVSEVVEKELTEDTELVEAKVIETVVEKVEAKPDDKPEQDEQPEPSEPVSEVVEKELTEDTELVEAKVIETVVEKVEAKPDDKPEQDEQPEPSEPVSEELTEDTELVEAKVIETVVEKVEAKPDDKPEQDEQPEPSEPVSEVVEKEEKTDLMVGEQSMNFLKIGSSMAPPDEKRHDIQSPGSCMSFTTTTSENIESISHDVESRSNFGGTLQPDIPTEYERSVSLSDNAASDYSNESATKYNLPYDTESDGHDAGAHKARLRGIKSQEGIAEPKQVKSAKLIAVDQRHGSASPQSDITEYTESVSYVDSIIDSTNYESALKQKETKQELRSKETSKDSCEADVKPKRKATKPSKPASAATPGVPEGATGSTKHGISSTGARKIEVKESKFTTKSATGRSSSTVVTTSSTLICSEQLYTKSTNYTAPGNAQTMADIPLISITQECSDDEELSTSSATNNLNIEDALTDTEDLMMDGAGQRERKSASSSPVPPEPNSLSLLEALQSPLAGALTDVEDYTYTEHDDALPTSTRSEG